MQVDTASIAYMAVLGAMLSLASIALSLRLWVSVRLTKSFGAADCILTASHCINVGGTIVWLVYKERARHLKPHTEEYHLALSLPFCCIIAAFLMAALLAKIAIGMWFLKIVRSPLQRIIIFLPLGAFCIATVVCGTFLLFRCGTPINVVQVLNDDDCGQFPHLVQGVGFSYSILNTICDIAFAVVPMHMVVTAKAMTWRQKLLAGGLICFAVAGTMFSILRLPWIASASLGPTFISGTEAGRTVFYSFLETAFGVFTISAAMLRPLCRRLRSKHIAWKAKRAKRSSSGAADIATHIIAYQSDPIFHETMEIKSEVKQAVRIDFAALRDIGFLPDTSLADYEGDNLDEVACRAHDWVDPSYPSSKPLGSYHFESIAEVMSDASSTVAESGSHV